MRTIDVRKFIMPIFQPLYNDRHRYKCLFGGRGGGKSTNTARIGILKMQSDGRINIAVFRQNEKDNSKSTFNEFKNAIDSFSNLVYETAIEQELAKGNPYAEEVAQKERSDYQGLWKISNNPMKITYIPCGNSIVFYGFNDPNSIKSIKPAKGYYCFLWLEEAQAIQRKEDFDDVDKSFRGLLPEGLWIEWYITFNSPANTHWLKNYVENACIKFNFPENKYINSVYNNYTYKSIGLEKGQDETCVAHYSIYRDNPYLSSTDLTTYERDIEKNKQYYEHEMLGEFGSTAGRIYDNYVIEDFNIQEIIRPKRWREHSKFKILAGLDYGFVHPNAFYMCAISREEKEVYVFDGFSMGGLTNDEIAGKIISMGYGKERIVCDNAEPKTILDLKKILKNLKAVHKYRGSDNSSIMQGVKLVKGYKIHIKPNLRQFIDSITNYSWDTDKYGNSIERPIQVNDDECDALRYVVMYAEKQQWGFGDMI